MPQKAFFFFLVSLISIPGAFSQCRLDKSAWVLVFNEEFDTDINELKARWKIKHEPQGYTGFYNPFDTITNIELREGYAYFHTRKLSSPFTHNGKEYLYTCGTLVSNFDDVPYCNSFSGSGFLYGMFEIRCKLPKTKGSYPSYWLTGNTAWPPEIDVFEYHGDSHDYFFSTVFWGSPPDPPHCTNSFYYPFDLTDEFHTWTITWTPTQISWFFDGKEVKTDTVAEHMPGNLSPGMWERCRWAKMNQVIGSQLSWPDPWETNFDPFIVDYIKVYKPRGYKVLASGDGDYWHDKVIAPLYRHTPYKTSYDWNLKRIHAADTYSAYAGLCALQEGKIFFRGDNNSLWYIDQANDDSVTVTPFDKDVTPDGMFSVAGNNNIIFFRKGSQLRYTQDKLYKAKTAFYPGRRITNVGPAIISNPNGLQVIYLGTDNNIWEASREDTNIHTWTSKRITNTADGTDEMMFDPSDRNNVFYKNDHSQLVHLAFNGTWTSSLISVVADVDGALSISPSGDRIYYKTKDSRLHYYMKNDSTWLKQSFYAYYPGNHFYVVNNVAGSIRVNENPYEIYYIGTEGYIWLLQQEGNNWHSSVIDATVSGVKELYISSFAGAGKRLYFIGADKQLRYFQHGPCAVTPGCGTATKF